MKKILGKVLPQNLFYALDKQRGNLFNLLLGHVVRGSHDNVVTFRPFPIRPTDHSHNDKTVFQRASLNTHRKRIAFEFGVIRFCKVELDSPEASAPTDIKCERISDGIWTT